MADLLQIGSFQGTIETNEAVSIASIQRAIEDKGMGITTIAIRKISLYNPNTVNALFQLRKRITGPDGEDLFLRRENDKILPSKLWKFGEFGGFFSLDKLDHHYDVLLDSEPTLPIEFIVDYGFSL